MLSLSLKLRKAVPVFLTLGLTLQGSLIHLQDRTAQEINGVLLSDSTGFDSPAIIIDSIQTPPYFAVADTPDDVFFNNTNATILGFAIIGFPKCGTTTLHTLMDAHPQLATIPGENYANSKNNTDRLNYEIMRTRELHPNAIKVGYRQSHDLYNVGVTATNFRTLYPTAPLIVTVRHPISWLESYWNFRSNFNGKQRTKPINVLKLQQRRGDLMHGIETGRLHLGMGYFHHFLALLGKTPQTINSREHELLQIGLAPGEWNASFPTRHHVPNPILLTTTEQMKQTKNNTFLVDLQRFLGLSEPFPGQLPHVRPSHWLSDEEIAISEMYQENICKPKYDKLRKMLQEMGTIAAEWIIEYLLPSPGVYTSGDLRPYIQAWKEDPCTRNSLIPI